MSAVTESPSTAAEPRTETVVAGGTRISVLSAGDGFPLVYLHGAGDLGGWLPALGGLSGSFRVVRPDHPGFNGSDDAPGVDSVAAMADLYVRILDALGVDRCHLVGTSLGGWLAAELALRIPARVARLVLVDPAGLPAATPAPNMFEVAPEVLVELTCGDAESLAAGRARDAAVRADAVLRERRGRNGATTARLAGEPYLHDPGLAARLPGLRTPTLLVWGALDGLCPVETADRWTAALPDARLHVVDGAGHLPLVDRPAEFVQVVNEFLSAPAPSPARADTPAPARPDGR
jgi:pimeloyl-ACP methyl ester carboxylesterase